MARLRLGFASLALIVAGSLAVSAIAGCSGSGGYEGPKRAPVKGEVALDGQPVQNGIINFIPVGEGRRVSEPIKDGKYDIVEARGPNLGTHKVEIIWMKPTGKKIKTDEGEQDETVQAVPAKYNAQTTLQAEIKAGPNEHNFRLESK